MSEAKHFLRTQAVLQGSGVPLSSGASKVLRFMLEQDDGCDCEIQPGRFQIRFGWNPHKHQYFESLAPSVVSALLRWAHRENAIGPVQFKIAGRTVPRTKTFFSWEFGDRAVWLRPAAEVLHVIIRDAKCYAEELPPPIPAPVNRPPIFVVPEEPLSCPHCGKSSERYRALRKALVCLECGRSFVQ